MKTLILLFVFTLSIIAQDTTIVYSKISINPDGENISFHIAPFLTQTNASGDLETETKNYFNINVIVKIPLSNSLTISPFYEHNRFEYDTNLPGIEKVKNNLNKFGLTVSFYLK